MTKSELTKKLDSAVNFLESELAQVRTGRASPSLIENLVIRAYDSNMMIKELGTISAPEPQLITVSPWDKSLIPVIAKAIRESELQLNPAEDADLVRIPIPQLTEERRKEFARLVTSKVEDSKKTIRNIRQDAMKSIDKQHTDKLISEDEKFTLKDEFEDIVKIKTRGLEELGEAKRADILAI